MTLLLKHAAEQAFSLWDVDLEDGVNIGRFFSRLNMDQTREWVKLLDEKGEDLLRSSFAPATVCKMFLRKRRLLQVISENSDVYNRYTVQMFTELMREKWLSEPGLCAKLNLDASSEEQHTPQSS